MHSSGKCGLAWSRAVSTISTYLGNLLPVSGADRRVSAFVCLSFVCPVPTLRTVCATSRSRSETANPPPCNTRYTSANRGPGMLKGPKSSQLQHHQGLHCTLLDGFMDLDFCVVSRHGMSRTTLDSAWYGCSMPMWPAWDRSKLDRASIQQVLRSAFSGSKM